MLVVAVVLTLAACGSPADRSKQVGADVGGTCTADTYGLTNQLTGKKTRIYDCVVGGRSLCVTEQDGVARDVTAMVRLLFAGTLGASRPDCLG